MDDNRLTNLAYNQKYTISEFNSNSNKLISNELTDGNYGTTDFHDTAWSIFKGGITRSVVFDFESCKSIWKINANFLEDGKNEIEFPHTVSFYASLAGTRWSTLTHAATKYRPFTNNSPRVQTYCWCAQTNQIPLGDNIQFICARYIMVTFKTNGLIYADQIEVLGSDGIERDAIKLLPDSYDYLESGDKTDNIENLVLLYNGWYENNLGDWTKDKLIPYISYVNAEKQPQSWFFDSVLYLALWSPWNRSFEGQDKPSNLDDWKWYLNKQFKIHGDLEELNESVKEVSAKLNDPEYRLKVLMMIPYPSSLQSNFGYLDGEDNLMNFDNHIVGDKQALNNRKHAVKWYISQVLEHWNASQYSHLQLSGLYWLHEWLEYDVPFEAELVQYAGQITHDHSLKYYWIPFFNANRDFSWRQLGFDAAILQPNHFFYETEKSRIQDCAQLAKQYGMGIEIEFDEQINSDPEYFKKFINYLNGGVDFKYMNKVFKGYYQGNTTLLESAYSMFKDIRENYDRIYRFVKGIYEKE